MEIYIINILFLILSQFNLLASPNNYDVVSNLNHDTISANSITSFPLENDEFIDNTDDETSKHLILLDSRTNPEWKSKNVFKLKSTCILFKNLILLFQYLDLPPPSGY